MRNTAIGLVVVKILSVFMIVTAAAENKAPAPLPFARDFKAERFFGKWYEVARLPNVIQPAGTLAVAEYAAGKEAGQVTVKNTSFDKAGKKLSDITGQAKLADGEPPGRLLVSFGPVLPETPNYYVIYVDEAYRYAVVGVPDRKSLWILAREVPVPEESLKPLREIAQKAGFDVTKLLVAPWDKVPKVEQDGAGQPAAHPESK